MRKLIIILSTTISIFSYAQNSFPTENAIWVERIVENIVYENGEKTIYTNNDVWIEGMGSFAGIFGNNINHCLCFDWFGV